MPAYLGLGKGRWVGAYPLHHSHPNDMDDELIEAHGNCAKLMPYLHLPVQSGVDHILKRMNRSHTAESYLRVIERIRAARPDIVLSGDFHRGFPRRD